MSPWSCVGGPLRLDDEGAEQSETDLRGRVVVRVVHVRSRVRHGELVGEAAPGFTGGCVMNGTPSMSFGSSRPWKWIAVDSSIVLEDDPNAIAFTHANLRTRNLAVVGHRGDHAARVRPPIASRSR